MADLSLFDLIGKKALVTGDADGINPDVHPEIAQAFKAAFRSAD